MKTPLLYAAALIACAFSLFPPLWGLLVSFTSVEGGQTGLAALTLDHYADILTQSQFREALWHSFASAFLGTLLAMVLGIMAAYGMTRFGGDFERLALLMLALRMIPGIVLVIPFYLFFRGAGLLDTVFGLTLSYLTFTVPFAIWMIRSFFTAIPEHIDEAAALDGAGSWTVLWRIIVPMTMPALITTAVLIFCFCWNEFLFALILTDQAALTFLPLVTRFVLPQGPLYGQIFAGSTIFLIIPLLALFAVRRRLEDAFGVSGVK